MVVKNSSQAPTLASESEHFFSKQIIKPNCREFFFVLFLINSVVNFDQIVRSLFLIFCLPAITQSNLICSKFVLNLLDYL
jgi:hypothetical protein